MSATPHCDAPQGDVTKLLAEWRGGDQSALGELLPLVYGELRRLAHHYMLRENRCRGLQTTALVHEAYIRLTDAQSVRIVDRVHFFAICATFMRRFLVDIARQEHARKRGGDARHVLLDEGAIRARAEPLEVIAVDEALSALAVKDARMARIVELRYFGGLSVDETALALDISRTTVLREWKAAKSWLRGKLAQAQRRSG